MSFVLHCVIILYYVHDDLYLVFSCMKKRIYQRASDRGLNFTLGLGLRLSLDKNEYRQKQKQFLSNASATVLFICPHSKYLCHGQASHKIIVVHNSD